MLDKAFEIFNLKGKKAIVTGGSRGMGRAIALDLATFGSDVIVADLNEEDGKKLVNEIRAMDREAFFVNADVSKKKEANRIIDFALDKFKKVDILINNAGILSGSDLEVSEEDWDRLMDINLKGVLFCSQAVTSSMKEQKSGKIINIGSSMSSRGSTFNISGGGLDYCISKAGVQALTRTFAFRLAPYGINVNAVAPGIINTPMHKDKERLATYAKYIPLGRLGEPHDVSRIVTLLATDAACYITGQTIHVNGGLLMID